MSSCSSPSRSRGRYRFLLSLIFTISMTGLLITNRRVSSRQTRYFLLHQRKYPKSVSRGQTPWRPPAELKCADSFPASWTRRCPGSSDGLRPAADRIGTVSSTQLGAYQGKELGAWHSFHASSPRAISRQAPCWVHEIDESQSAQGHSPPGEPPRCRICAPEREVGTPTDAPVALIWVS